MSLKWKLLLGLAAAAAVFALAVAAAPLGLKSDTPNFLLIENARILDARTSTPATSLLIEGGRIVAWEPRTDDIPRFDAGGRFVVPGLIDLHSHMLRAGYCSGDEGVAFDNLAQIPFNFDVALRAGHTTVVDLGGPLAGVVSLRNGLSEEDTLAPRYLVAGPILTAPGGYPLDWADPDLASDLDVVVELPDEAAARQAVDRLADAGVDVLKIAYMELAYNERPLPVLKPSVFRAAVDRAHQRELPVFVHAHTNAGYEAALDAGADVIAHSTFEPLTEALVQRVSTSSVVIVPTLWVFSSFEEARARPDALLAELKPQLMPSIYAALSDFDRRYRESPVRIPPDFLPGLEVPRMREANRNARDNLRRLAAAGATIGYGTDTSFCYALHASAHRELGELVKAGLTPRQAFAAATIHSARALGRDDLGVVTPGAAGDLLILDEDPRSSPEAFARPYAVVRAGRLLRAEASPPGLLRSLRIAARLIGALFFGG